MSFVSRCGHFECGWRRSTAYCQSAWGHEVHYAVWYMLLENSIRTEVVLCRYLYKTHKRWKFTIDFNIIEFFLEIGAVVKFYFQMYRRTIWIFADKCSSFKKCAKDVPALRDNRKKARVNWRVTDVKNIKKPYLLRFLNKPFYLLLNRFESNLNI